MTASQTTTSKRAAAKAVGRLFLLNLGGEVFSTNPDGSGKRVLASGYPLPDGIVVDVEAGHIYWTNMGTSPKTNDGFIERADLDGGNRKTIIPPGITYTPKQLHLEKQSGKLYWSDREGMRVMRANLDGSGLETLVQTGEGDADRKVETKWCVGIAVDPDRGHIYWTQKGPDNADVGQLLRAGIEIPKGQTASTRKDIEVLYDRLPEPIDIELDRQNRLIYWTDRGDPPRGNTVNRAPMDAGRNGRPAPEILFTHLMEGIGIALDLKGGRMFMTDLAGSIYSARLDGSRPTVVLMAQGNVTGIAYADIPATEV